MPDQNLTARAEVLTRSVAALTISVQQLADSQAHVKKVMRWTVVGLILDLVLSLAAVALFNRQREANHRLADNTAHIEQVQTRTSDKVLCPLYALFIAFEPRAIDNPGFTPEERQERRQAYAVIHQGYDILGCH